MAVELKAGLDISKKSEIIRVHVHFVSFLDQGKMCIYNIYHFFFHSTSVNLVISQCRKPLQLSQAFVFFLFLSSTTTTTTKGISQVFHLPRNLLPQQIRKNLRIYIYILVFKSKLRNVFLTAFLRRWSSREGNNWIMEYRRIVSTDEE